MSRIEQVDAAYDGKKLNSDERFAQSFGIYRIGPIENIRIRFHMRRLLDFQLKAFFSELRESSNPLKKRRGETLQKNRVSESTPSVRYNYEVVGKEGV